MATTRRASLDAMVSPVEPEPPNTAPEVTAMQTPRLIMEVGLPVALSRTQHRSCKDVLCRRGVKRRSSVMQKRRGWRGDGLKSGARRALPGTTSSPCFSSVYAEVRPGTSAV